MKLGIFGYAKAGKTTLFSLILNEASPDSPRITLGTESFPPTKVMTDVSGFPVRSATSAPDTEAGASYVRRMFPSESFAVTSTEKPMSLSTTGGTEISSDAT